MDASSLRHALAAGKFGVPAAHARHIDRTPLLARILNAAHNATVLVRAPAGFGKTTLLAQCARHFERAGAQVAWLTLDRSDNDLSRCLRMLVAALGAAGIMAPAHDDGDDVAGQTPHASSSPEDTLALAILDALAAHSTQIVLIIDEMEMIDDPAVLDFMNRVLVSSPHSTRVLIGARHVPALAWHRLRMAGRLLELDAGALAFTMHETTQFLSEGDQAALTPSDMQLLHGKTEGWVAALWLASLSLAGSTDTRGFIARFSGDDRAVAQCLSHDVFDRQPAHIQRFLLATSILRRIDAPLCQSLLPEIACAEVIDALARADIVLRTESGDGRSYRYHSMFAAYLQARLREAYPDEVALLHRRAATWYDEQGRAVPAIDHAIEGGAFALAATLLVRHADALLEQGRLRLLSRWFAQLPAQALPRAGDLGAIRIWALLFTRGPSDAMVELDLLGQADDLNPTVQSHMLALRPLLLSMLDQHEQAYAVGMPALAKLAGTLERPTFAQTALTNAMANVAAVLGKYAQARDLLDRARASQSGQSFFNTMYSEAIEGSIDLQAGRFKQASARFRLAVGATRGAQHGRANGNAWAGVLHAACVYERGDLDDASRLLDVYVPLGRDVGLPDHLIMGYLMQSRIAARKVSVEQAYVLLGELEYLGHHRRLPRVAASARLERARVLLLQGHVQAAQDELRRAENPDLWTQMAALHLSANDFLYPRLSRLRWEAYAGDAQSALVHLAQERAVASEQGRVRRTWKLDMLTSVAAARASDDTFADTILADVLTVAADQGLHGCIVDEGAPMLERLADFAKSAQGRRWMATSNRETVFEQWLRGFSEADKHHVASGRDAGGADRAGGDDKPEALTRKEVAVLTLVAEGLSNTAIAARLFVSESTVRTHLRHLNVKLSASSRTQAVVMARRAGLID